MSTFFGLYVWSVDLFMGVLDHIAGERHGRSSLVKTHQKAQSSISSGNMRKRLWYAFRGIEMLVLNNLQGSGNLRLAVQLPEGEDLNEWLAVHSELQGSQFLM